ncbi:MAG: alpha-glucosidase C-terminal domain-containing protein [Bacteroidia bacterium]|nr:alpha-glucosidase C-terminal domain-containing protein [Bacteroidia bacterium]
MPKYPFLLLIVGLLLFSCKPKPEPETDALPQTVGVVHPEWSKNANIYEVNVRQYTPEGTLKAFEAHLPRLKEMGVDILWLMPIFPIGEEKRKGDLGSYYAVKDYRGVNPDMGTMQDLQDLIKKAHEMGMKVILDWVANHTAWDNPLITQHPDWYTRDSAGNFQPPVADWSDVVDLNYDSQGLRDYMIESMRFWIREADIDGYRCDVAGMVPTDFWDTCRVELDKLKPVFMLAEDEGPQLHDHAFDMTYGWEFHHLMNQIAQGKESPAKIHDYLKNAKTKFPASAYRMNFTSNHDENSWNGTEFERMGDAYKVMAVLAFTVEGMPLIYSGQEAGLDRRLSFFGKDEIDWKENEMAEMYKTLLKLKHENQAIWNGEFGGEVFRIPSSNDEAVFAFVREKGENKVFGIFNLSPAEVTVTLPSGPHPDVYKEVFSGENATIRKGQQYLIPAWGWWLYAK